VAPGLPRVEGASAQTVQWVRAVGGASSDYGHDVAVDAAGDLYAVGMFTGTAQIGGATLTGVGGFDVYVAKLDATGDVEWVRAMGGAGYDSVHGVAVDTAGNVYAAGSFTGSATFAGQSLSAVGDQDAFVAKLDAATGDLEWAVAMGGPLWDSAWRVAVDSAGGVFTTGSFRGTAAFGSFSLVASGEPDAFVARLDAATGTVQWAMAMGGTGYDHGNGIAVDAAGFVYTAGDFEGVVDFGGVSLTAVLTGAFVAKHDPATGAVQWARAMGGDGWDAAESVAVGSDGRVYTAGNFGGTASFGDVSLTSAGDPDAFVARLDAATGDVVWARAIGGAGYDYGVGVAADATGDAYATGTFQGTVDVGGESLTAPSYQGVFVVKLGAATGDVGWARAMGGGDYDRAGGVAVDQAGNVYTTGWFSGTAFFGEVSLTSAGGDDAFIVKLGASSVVADWDTVSDEIRALRAAVLDLGLSAIKGGSGTEKSLLSKLDSALKSATREDTDGTIDKLTSFADQVGDLPAKTVSPADAAELIGMAEDIVVMVQAL
jgi:hypothetical protein